MTEKEVDKILNQLAAVAFRRKHKCFVTDCNETAIHSHLIQRKGVLNNIITNGHLYEVIPLLYPKTHYSIKRVGWKDALTFYGFCAHHDSKLFEQIEKGNINYEDYQSLLLLSYRPVLHEYRLKENIIDAFTKMQRNEKLQEVTYVLGMQIAIEAQTYLLWDVEYMLSSLQEDLQTTSKHYEFCTVSLPKIEVYTSITFSYHSLAHSFRSFPNIDIKQKELIASIIFHIIPTATHTKLILGYHRESEKHLKPKVHYFLNLNQQQLLKAISDTIIKSCGTWACSEAFYKTKIKPREKDILKLMNYFVLRKQYSNEDVKINLFE